MASASYCRRPWYDERSSSYMHRGAGEDAHESPLYPMPFHGMSSGVAAERRGLQQGLSAMLQGRAAADDTRMLEFMEGAPQSALWGTGGLATDDARLRDFDVVA
eukprot:TRINITY_DN23058_c0_g1_i2.p1 TRINITY_DN23058_c0_g1~~TRINITY_DN23058_c0_g1_i2.p1  ORF type:complete len:104 (+),score=6.01 TRINITY_DN23058_c0_g1_i2:107-418(+)